MACNLDDFANTLRDDRHRRAFAYWRSKAPEGRLPGRRDIDPLDVPDLLPWLTLVDAIWEGTRLRLRCRLIGTEVVIRFGRDITGLYAEEAYPGDYLAQALETYGAIIKSRRPHLSRHQILWNRQATIRNTTQRLHSTESKGLCRFHWIAPSLAVSHCCAYIATYTQFR